MDIHEITLAIGMFTAIVLTLVVIIVVARALLVHSGNVNISINGQREVVVQSGSKLMQTLAAYNIFLPSACGGGGTCGQCKCQVLAGGGDMLPTEAIHFTRHEAHAGWR
ncbi:MAG: 2Fe-2S iron-sulfur cluster binding domain-containing protein, partial [Zoogloeaceae bacterium]|nr:2Fe-2S iron-sulfur cluster binding domain-containing protein [Zoogloeaceae bacterium]